MASNIRDETFFDDEESEAAINETIEQIVEAIYRDEQGVMLTDPKKMRDFTAVYKLMKHITSGKHLKITYEINKPFKTMAYISVLGENLRFTHPELFVMASRIATNVNIFPRVDGSVQIDFTFNGYANRID